MVVAHDYCIAARFGPEWGAARGGGGKVDAACELGVEGGVECSVGCGGRMVGHAAVAAGLADALTEVESHLGELGLGSVAGARVEGGEGVEGVAGAGAGECEGGRGCAGCWA